MRFLAKPSNSSATLTASTASSSPGSLIVLAEKHAETMNLGVRTSSIEYESLESKLGRLLSIEYGQIIVLVTHRPLSVIKTSLLAAATTLFAESAARPRIHP
ncbi:hypothetical protein [Pyrofollis japonicus]|nr:hypothetical protein [Pyrofollis japonicus]